MDRQVVEQIRMLKARGLGIDGISKSVDLPPETIEQVLKDVYKTVDPYTEIMSAVDTYSVMISDLSLMIHNIQGTDDKELDVKDNKQLMELFDKRTKLQESKVKLLTDISDKYKNFQGKQMDFSSYENTPKEPTTNNKCNIFMYKIIALLSNMGYKKKTLKDLKTSDRKLIRKTVGCTKEEMKICLNMVKEKNFPSPLTELEISLRKEWI